MIPGNLSLAAIGVLALAAGYLWIDGNRLAAERDLEAQARAVAVEAAEQSAASAVSLARDREVQLAIVARERDAAVAASRRAETARLAVARSGSGANCPVPLDIQEAIRGRIAP